MYKTFKYFDQLFFQPLKKADIIVDHGIVHRVFDVPALLLGQDDRGLRKLFEVVTDRRLRKVDVIVEIDAIQPIVLLLDLTQDLQSRWIRKGLGDLLRLFRIHLRHMTNYLYVRYGKSASPP